MLVTTCKPLVLHFICKQLTQYVQLLQEDGNCSTFAKHFDVRFAEHTLNILKAVLNNLEAARKLWSKMTNGTIETDKTEKTTVQGFLRKWKKGTQQVIKCNLS